MRTRQSRSTMRIEAVFSAFFLFMFLFYFFFSCWCFLLDFVNIECTLPPLHLYVLFLGLPKRFNLHSMCCNDAQRCLMSINEAHFGSSDIGKPDFFLYLLIGHFEPIENFRIAKMSLVEAQREETQKNRALRRLVRQNVPH